MRTTLTIDDDVLAAARGLAVQQRKTVGEVVSALSRQALGLEGPVSPAATRNGVALLPAGPRATAVRPELVNRLRDELT